MTIPAPPAPGESNWGGKQNATDNAQTQAIADAKAALATLAGSDTSRDTLPEVNAIIDALALVVGGKLDKTEAAATYLDWRGRTPRVLAADRDFGVQPIAFWDPTQLTGNDGDPVGLLPDLSGNGYGLGAGGALRPTLVANALNGKPALRFSASQYLRTSKGLTNWGARPIAQPITMAALVKFRSAGANAIRLIMSSESTIGMGAQQLVSSASGYDRWLYTFAAGAAVGGGPSIVDDQWHVVIAIVTPNSYTLMVDGVVTSPAVANTGTASLTGRIVLGGYATTPGALGLDGDLGPALMLAGELTLKQCQHLTEYIRQATLYKATPTPKQDSVIIDDFTDANGQNVRTLRTANMGANPPVLVMNHHQGVTHTWWQPGNNGYTLAHVAANAGWLVVCPANHNADGWTGAPAVADGPAAVTAAASRYGVTPALIAIHGQSMGGALAMIQATSPIWGSTPVKGVHVVDAALNMEWAYRSSGYATSVISGLGCVAGTLAAAVAANDASFTSTTVFNVGDVVTVDRAASPENVTITSRSGTTGTITYGISGSFAAAHTTGKDVVDFPTKVIGRDPAKLTSAQFNALRAQVVYGPNDATVLKANNLDVFAPILAGSTAPEKATITHPGNHLESSGFRPIEFADFLTRCTS